MITLAVAGDDRHGSKSYDWEIESPTLEETICLISRLDGSRYTEICVTESEPFRYLLISGGSNLFLVTGETVGGDIVQLTDPQCGSDEIALVCGGQVGIFKRSDLVTKDQAVNATTDFWAGFPQGFGADWLVT